MQKVDVSIILACYNEGQTLEESVSKIVSILKKTRKTYEIIFVEDKSLDETKKSVEKLVSEIKNAQLHQNYAGQARAIYHIKNQGRGKSVVDGIRASRGEICGFLDVDLEVSANYIPLFIKELEGGYDLVVGKRFYERGLKSLSRFLASKVYALAVKKLLGLPIDDTEAGYKFFRRSKIIPLLSKVKSKRWFFDTEICAQTYWHGFEISQVPVLFKRKANKKSTVRLIPDTIDYIINLVRLRGEAP